MSVELRKTTSSLRRRRSCSAFPARLVAIAVVLLSATVRTPPSALAGTPYEAQLGQRLNAVLTNLIIGEFGGRTRANPHYRLGQRICQPADYDILREAAKDNATLIEFRRRCKLLEGKIDSTYVYGTAYLPPGYCETLRAAFEAVLAVHVYPVSADSKEPLVFEHKGLRFDLAPYERNLIRRAQVQVTCNQDDSILVRALAKRP